MEYPKITKVKAFPAWEVSKRKDPTDIVDVNKFILLSAVIAFLKVCITVR